MLRSVMAAGLVLVSAAALADNKSDCLDSKDHDLRIKGCSTLIQHNPKDVVAYHNRGEAYGLKGDSDRAISDYSQAIALNPNYAPAYNGRGRAYTSKGDYVHAVADVTKAGELTRKVQTRPAVVKGALPKAKTAATPGSASLAAKPSVAGTAHVEKPSDDSLPAWVKSTVTN